jgi:glucose/arabinose dehydrogenase
MHGKAMKSTLVLGFLTVGLTAVSVFPGLAADQPGQHFSVLPQDMPKPYATPAADNSSKEIPRPPGVTPAAPPGFAVSVFAAGLTDPRWMTVAPNGDGFLTEPTAGKISVLRDTKGAGRTVWRSRTALFMSPISRRSIGSAIVTARSRRCRKRA